MAVDWIKKDRKLLKLLTYKSFIDLGESVRQYNEYMQRMQEHREELKQKREKKKEMFMQNHELVADITNLH